MLAANDLRKVAARSGARDIGNVEIDVVLTFRLQLFNEAGLADHLAFKGGTMLRKMVFGPRGRLSTDLDFTRRTDIDPDDLLLEIIGALQPRYHGLEFRLERDKEYYVTQDGCAANPLCVHEANKTGVRIKLQVSAREAPILPVEPLAQLKQDYFRLLPFQPADVPCLAFEEVVAEKIRAASQRAKARDVHDLAEISKRPLRRDIVRGLAVLKLWHSDGPGLSYAALCKRVRGGADYDLSDLGALLRKDQKPDLEDMVDRVVEGFRFLDDMREHEAVLAADAHKSKPTEAAELAESVRHAAQDTAAARP